MFHFVSPESHYEIVLDMMAGIFLLAHVINLADSLANGNVNLQILRL